MSARGIMARLGKDQSGSVIVEFAILGPVVMGLMIGILQVSIGMQANNAVRNITADTARYAMVEYQKENTPNNAAIKTQAESIATSSPYSLDAPNLTVTVANAATQRVGGAREITISVTYDVPDVLPFFNWASPTIVHTRPIFVLT